MPSSANPFMHHCPSMYMTPRIVALNGPPGAGKSTIARWICTRMGETFDPCIISMKAPLVAAANALFVAFDAMPEAKRDRIYAEFKNSSIEVGASSATGRQFMIAFSERCLKPLFGTDVLGHMAWDAIMTHYYQVHRAKTEEDFHQPLYIIEDAGFYDEQCVLWQKATQRNYLLVRLHRWGVDWEDDSRSHIEPPEDIHAVDLYNNDSLVDVGDVLVDHIFNHIIPEEQQ